MAQRQAGEAKGAQAPPEVPALAEMMMELEDVRQRDDAASAVEQARRLALAVGLDGPASGVVPIYEAVEVHDPMEDEAAEQEFETTFLAGIGDERVREVAGSEYRSVRERFRIERWRRCVEEEAAMRRQRLERDLEGIALRVGGAPTDAMHAQAMEDFWRRLEPMQPWLSAEALEDIRDRFQKTKPDNKQ